MINMFGTTETQRAVSYYEIPPIATPEGKAWEGRGKDIVPAGQGMVVSLLDK
jgi:L-2-aminoadipate reductase